jgi:hypothetical protein
LRAGRKIVAWLSGDGDYILFMMMTILPVAAARSLKIPTIFLDQVDHRANFHCSECWQFHFPSSNIGCSALASDL